MKPIKTTPMFQRSYKQRVAKDGQLKQAFRESVNAFQEDRASVNDHPLQGKMGLQRSFWVTEDYRVVYTETEDYYLFQDIGPHQEVYTK